MGNVDACILCCPSQSPLNEQTELKDPIPAHDSSLATVDNAPVSPVAKPAMSPSDPQSSANLEFGPAEQTSPFSSKEFSSGSSDGAQGGTLKVDPDAKVVRRKSRGGTGVKFNYKVLSKVQETSVDVQYRLEFFVAGVQAQRAVRLVCACEGVTVPPEGDHQLDQLSKRAKSGRGLGNGVLPHTNCIIRCHGNACKLSLTMADSFDDAPTCKSAAEAASALCMRLLIVKSGDDSHDCISKQLLDVSQWLSERRQNRQKLCLIFCETSEIIPRTRVWAGGGDGTGSTASVDWLAQADAVDLDWEKAMDIFEDEHGPQWKYGPLNMDDPDTMHEIFLEIANTLLGSNSEQGKSEMTKITEYPSDGQASQARRPSTTSLVGALSKSLSGFRRNSKKESNDEEPIGNFPFDEWSDPTANK